MESGIEPVNWFPCKYKNFILVSLPTEEGRVPRKLLGPRPRRERETKLPTAALRVPVRWFWWTASTCRFVNPENMAWGSVPVKAFSDRPSHVRAVSAARVGGSDEERALEAISRVCREVSWPISEGREETRL